MQVSLWFFAWGKYWNDTMGRFYTEFMLDIQTWYELDMIEIICAYQHLGSNGSRSQSQISRPYKQCIWNTGIMISKNLVWGIWWAFVTQTPTTVDFLTAS